MLPRITLFNSLLKNPWCLTQRAQRPQRFSDEVPLCDRCDLCVRLFQQAVSACHALGAGEWEEAPKVRFIPAWGNAPGTWVRPSVGLKARPIRSYLAKEWTVFTALHPCQGDSPGALLQAGMERTFGLRPFRGRAKCMAGSGNTETQRTPGCTEAEPDCFSVKLRVLRNSVFQKNLAP